MNKRYLPTKLSRRILCHRAQIEIQGLFQLTGLQPGTHFTRCRRG